MSKSNEDEIKHWSDMVLHWGRMGNEKARLQSIQNLNKAKEKAGGQIKIKSKNESISELIEAITREDFIEAEYLFTEAVMHRIDEKISTKKKQVSLIQKALQDKNIHVRMAAAKHPNASQEHLETALNDKHLHVKLAALSNPNIDKKDDEEDKEAKNAEVKKKIISHLDKLK